MSTTFEVRAAGAVVWRDEGQGPEVLVVHRRRYDDWSLPKGKLEPGEGWKKGALREVEEETGRRCVLGPELRSSKYRVGRTRRPKLVRWWVMAPEGGSFEASREVDEAKWIKVAKAAGKLDYADDRRLVEEAMAVVRKYGPPG